MKETVVRVSTIEEWKAVLDVWFKQGHTWLSGDNKDYREEYFDSGVRKLLLTRNNNILKSPYTNKPFIRYADFMSQQKEDNKMETYYVTQSVFDTLQRIRANEDTSLIGSITWNAQFIESIKVGNKAIIRYLADDPAIEFKVKEQLYRLWRIDDDGDKVYLTFSLGTPDWDSVKDYAFTAPLKEIIKHKTISWHIEEAT